MLRFWMVRAGVDGFRPTHSLLLTAGFFAALGLGGCDSDQDEEEGDDSSDDGTSTDDPGDDDDNGDTDDGDLYDQACHAALDRGAAKIGESCNANIECESRSCLGWSNYSPPDAGECVDPPPNCLSRAAGEIVDVFTGERVPGATVGIVGGTEVVVNAMGARRVGTGVSDENGLYDTLTDEPVNTFYNVMTVVHNDDYYATVTVLDWPLDEALNYAPLLSLHTQYATKKSDLAAWNAALADDPDFADSLPLEEHGVAIGSVQILGYPVVRVEGAVISPQETTSSAKIRYVNDDGVTIGTEATSSNGMFIILGTEIGERFNIDYEGYKLTRWAARTGPVAGAVYATPFLLEPE